MSNPLPTLHPRGLPEDSRLWVEIPSVHDPRGSLSFLESERHAPFPIKRIFYLYNVGGAARGSHAHRALYQMIIPIHGSFSLHLDDAHRKTSLTLDNPARAVVVPPLVWADLDNFTPGSVCLVLASDVYDESDYIRDYETFTKEAHENVQ